MVPTTVRPPDWVTVPALVVTRFPVTVVTPKLVVPPLVVVVARLFVMPPTTRLPPATSVASPVAVRLAVRPVGIGDAYVGTAGVHCADKVVGRVVKRDVGFDVTVHGLEISDGSGFDLTADDLGDCSISGINIQVPAGCDILQMCSTSASVGQRYIAAAGADRAVQVVGCTVERNSGRTSGITSGERTFSPCTEGASRCLPYFAIFGIYAQ